MKIDIKTVRALGRLTDRMDLIRKHPHRYEITADDLQEIDAAAQRLEDILTKVKTIKAG